MAGFFLALAGLVYAGDAGGLWDTPWFAIIPMVTGGLCLAGATAAVAHGIRKARGPRPGRGSLAGSSAGRGPERSDVRGPEGSDG
ncbi:hypothetical protein STRAU_1068 [Streptomyces aurantiacus JA 4570]|uniref:Uncharacterized protein n=1 Tax=Streptomyces aurantiacus JA 4570 TaxID=1286094 RepID=S4AWP8_9ACTN|nr:hypothetical protein STRAU_1068 [Streptomyces aurantiacus JA 4570]